MIVGSINEDRKIESRVAITPDNVKKFTLSMIDPSQTEHQEKF